jgi:hypothetical protein
MEARRKGVAGRTVVIRNRRSNSGRSSRAETRLRGALGGGRGWFGQAPFPSRFRFQNGPRRQGFAAPRPHGRALDVSGPFRTAC